MNVFPAFGARQPPHEPGALARAILAQPRFRVQTTAGASRTWWDLLRRWIGDQWDRLMNAFAHQIKIGPVAGVAIGDLLVVLLVLLVVVVGARLLLTMVAENTAPGGIAVNALPAHADAAELFEAAQHAASGGAYAAAIAFAFRAALAALDARGALRDDPARTVNQCRRDVHARAPRFGPAFDVIAQAFTSAVYADERASEAQWNDVQRAYAAFTAAQRDAA